MNGRAFLDPAATLAEGPGEPYWRASVGRAYYALFQESLAALRRWGFAVPRRVNIHAFVRLKFAYTNHADTRIISDDLDYLVKLRNEADYEIATSGHFRTPNEVENALEASRRSIALLDAIESDPIRRAEVIASIRP